jgi:hypothetical protein
VLAVGRQDLPVHLRAPVAEQVPVQPVSVGRLQIHVRHENAAALSARLRDLLSQMVGDERSAVEPEAGAFVFFQADAVGRHHGQDVGRRVTAHDVLPVLQRGGVGPVDVGSDGGRVKQDLRALEGQDARGLGEPLVPADQGPDTAMAGLPDVEAGVAGIEIVLFGIAGGVGNVGLAIGAEIGAARVDHDERIVHGHAGTFENADRQDHVEFLGQLGEALHSRIFADRDCQVIVLGQLVLAEVWRLKQLLDEDDLRALASGFADELFGLAEIAFPVPTARHLGRGHFDAGHCPSSPSVALHRHIAIYLV